MAATAALLATALLVAASGPRHDSDLRVIAHPRHDIRFVLTGEPVKGLYPGAVRSIKVTVANPFGFPIVLRGLGGTLVETSRRGCPATPATLRVRGYSGRLPIEIKPYARRRLPGHLTAVMPVDATPKCANTRLVIALSGTGSRAGR